MVTRSSFAILLTVATLLFCPTVFGVEIDARVVKLEGGTEKSIQLVLTADDTPDAEPDFTSLMGDFYILNRSRNQSIKTINGQTSRSVRWTLQLLPKHAIIQRIPVIHFGRDSSPPVHLTEVETTKGFRPGIEESLAVPIRTTRPRAIRFEATPPTTTIPPNLGRATPPGPDGGSLKWTDLVLLGGFGGLFAVLITGYRNRRQRSTTRAREKIPSPPNPTTRAERVKRPPAPTSADLDVVDTPLRNHPVSPEQTVGMALKTPPPATVSTDLLEAGIATRQHLSPPEPMTRREGIRQSTTPLTSNRDVAGTAMPVYPSPPEQPIRTESEKLHHACLSTDPELAGAALLEWAGKRWPDAPPHTLGSLASQFAGTDVEREIRRLDKILYSPVKKKWHGTTLWQVMKGFMVEQEITPKKRHLFASFHIG